MRSIGDSTGSGQGNRQRMNIEELRYQSLSFISRHSVSNAGVGEFRYCLSVTQPTLYSSCYAAAARSLYDDLGSLAEDERQEWIAYLNRHQDDDGLYRDPVIFDQGWYAGDPMWCGRTHQTCHVIIALTGLGGVAAKEFQIVREFSDIATLDRWLAARDFGERLAWTGNEIMNVGTLLQYARDFHSDDRAAKAIEFLLDWLEAHWFNPETGVWGTLDLNDPLQLSHTVQAAYHWWSLYFYDQRPIPHVERAIDTVLKTQNPNGGFGWGVHNPTSPFISSACEDIDSIDPLARMSCLTDYRRADIHAALDRAAAWVLSNQMSDGGFIFIKDRPFEYGHPEFHGEADGGAMFPTWFRTLSLALIGKALPDHDLGKYPWYFVDCPGYQFWRDE